MQERPNGIYLVTGINKPYLTRAEPYLASIDRNSNVNNIVVTLDFEISREYIGTYPAIRFLSIASSQVQSPNPNSCMQHGGFLPAVDFLKEKDIIIYTDADIELQRPLRPSELELLGAFQDDEVGVGYNESPEDYLSREALKLEPTITSEELSTRYPGIDKLLTYNTGVLVANKRTYGSLYDLYNQHWPDFAPAFGHYAKQQWLLSYLVNRHFRPRLLPATFHTHGHRPVAKRVAGDLGYRFCVGSELVLFNHGMGHETIRLERRFRHLQRRVRIWTLVSLVLFLICLLLVWRLLA